MDKGIITKIHNQLHAAKSVGQLACAFSIEETEEILHLIGDLKDTIDRLGPDYEFDDDPGPPEDRDCAYWERVMREDL